jgi:ribonuclease HII
MQANTKWIAGVDEAGCGPLVGPVVAAAVIFDPKHMIKDLRDSKALTEKKRESFYQQIIETCVDYAVGYATAQEIDRINILQARLLAMQRAVKGLKTYPHHALIDGNRCPKLQCTTEAIVQGDQLEPLIMAASIIAKVTRDRDMLKLDQQYPGYGFAEHKGYGTRRHLAALKELGPCPEHRFSFAPVRAYQALSSTA